MYSKVNYGDGNTVGTFLEPRNRQSNTAQYNKGRGAVYLHYS